MKAEEFRALVAEMRKAQRRYFRTRKIADLREAKHLELKVDDALKYGPDQEKLFS